VSLDDRLREILTERYGFAEHQGDMADLIIAQIKRAFAEEGYQKTVFTHYPMEITQTIYDLHDERGRPVMTGQEWYDRFQKEYTQLLMEGHARKHRLAAGAVYRLAAQRAAALDEPANLDDDVLVNPKA